MPKDVNTCYIKLLNKLLKKGIKTNDRTNAGTLTLTNQVFKVNLQDEFPLLAIKKTNYDAILHELLWFISGSTDVRDLQANNVHIWDKDIQACSTAPFGGYIYGNLWRYFNADHYDKKQIYYNGFDQLQYIIDSLIAQINGDYSASRRIFMSSWHPDTYEKALPPCHVSCQFNLINDKLDCVVMQRSADVFLGLPFNIASYATLTHIIAEIINNICKPQIAIKPHKLAFMIGNCHLYCNHIDQAQQAITSVLHIDNKPSLHFNQAINNINDVKFSDITIKDYVPCKYIAAVLN